MCLTGLRRFDEAEAALLEARETVEAAVGPDHPQTLAVLRDLEARHRRRGASARPNSVRLRMKTR